ncbi:MAG: putative maturation protein [Frobavirus nemorishabitans]|uniref:Maturation protein n=1 Tax=Leviviridae sp. TaxID=2027243 RepID=A0ABY3SSA3_9VIRU|nr:MAG: putative maturation protein [Leviviridae sp.]
MSRIRTKVDSVHTGHVFRRVLGNVNADHDEICKNLSVCLDGTSPYPYTTAMPCDIDHFQRDTMIMFGQSNSNPLASNFVKITDMVPDYAAGTAMAHLPLPTMPTAAQDALKVLAFSNPNRGSGADLIQDVMEGYSLLPSSIYKAGKSVFERGADANLWWQFGMKPLIDDLKALLEHQQRLEQRLREFNSLFQKGGLRRRINLGSHSASDGKVRVALQSNYVSWQADREITTTATRWGVVRWTPVGWTMLDISRKEMIGRVRRLLYGGDLSPESLWNKMPWTWLVGWFSTVGLWLKANKNNFPVIAGPVSICTTYQTQFTFSTTSKTSYLQTRGDTISHQTKKRQIVPSGGIPLALMRQPGDDIYREASKSSILGSLAIVRLGNGRF